MKKNIIILLMAIFTSIAININLDTSVSLIDSFKVNETFLIIIFILYYLFFKQVLDIKDKRTKIVSIVIAIVLATFEIVGYSISRYYSLDGIIGSKTCLLKNSLKFIAYFITFYSILLILYTNILKKIKINDNLKLKEKKYFMDNFKSFIICTIIIFIAYIPYFLANYPGIFTTDSASEMSSALNNMGNLVNHHPILHIYIISICLKIGKAIGSDNIGIAIYSILQMIATAMTFSYTIRYMTKKNVNIYTRIISLIFFALYPPFAAYSVTMWKDVPFALAMLLFTIQIIEIVTNKEYINNIKNIVKFIIIMLLVILFRNNGIYVILITLPILLICLKDNRKKLSIITVLIIIFYILYKGPIFKALNITDGPVREALSVPIQQIARTVKYKGEELTDREKEMIYKYIPMENIGEKYYPLISDNVKDNFNNEEFKKNKKDFIILWLKLLNKYPKEYVEAFLDNSFGYWYPEAINWVIPTWYDYPEIESLNYKKHAIINSKCIENIESSVNARNVPFISLMWDIGFTFDVILISIGYVIVNKKRALILIYIPILALWLTTVASPVWCEYRYLYSMFTTILPLTIIPISIINIKNKEIDI